MIGFVLLLALLSAFPPLATDMYLPALPQLQIQWGAALSTINLTLVLFFVVYCFSLLIYGPLSDRFGRKPPLLWGIGIYVMGSLCCAVSQGVVVLILARIVQAFGAGAGSSIAMAMIKDRLEGKKREEVLGYLSVIIALAPMAAPMVGSLILEYGSWHGIFLAQAGMGLVAMAGVLFTRETLETPVATPVKYLVKNYVHTLKNRRFLGVVLCSSMAGLPLFSFIAASSAIYISGHGLSETRFALFFGGNALAFMTGAGVCTRLTRRVESRRLISWGFGGIALGGGLMVFNPFSGPWALALPMAMITFFLGMSRPPTHSVALEQVSQYAGAASSILIFVYFILGALAMGLVSLEGWASPATIGLLALVPGSFIWGSWQRISPALK